MIAKEYIPHAYQLEAYKHVMKHPFCGLFLDMGLGKTIITLTALTDMLLMGESKRILVIAPLRVANSVWKQEAAKWVHTSWLKVSIVTGTAQQRIAALEADAQIYVINRENVKWLITGYVDQLPFDTLVIDELSSFKSHSSQRFKALKKVRHRFKRIIGLTGTPMSNGYMDLWAEMYLLDGGKRLHPYITHYRNRYFNQERMGASEHAVKYILREGADVKINDLVSDICLSMKSVDYLELPEFIVNDVWVDMGEETLKDYKQFERDAIVEILKTKVSVDNRAALINKLLQYSNGAIYHGEEREYVNVHNAKLEALSTLIEKADYHPVLIAYQFKHDLERIQLHLKKNFPDRVVAVMKDDKTVQDWNAGKIHVLIAHPASAGHGLNLQYGGNTLIWFGLTWSLELYQQFNKRLHRQGTKNTVVCYRIMSMGTYDNIVSRTLEGKESVQDAFMKFIHQYTNN